MQSRTRVGRQPQRIAGVGRDLGLEQNDVERGVAQLSSDAEGAGEGLVLDVAGAGDVEREDFARSRAPTRLLKSSKPWSISRRASPSGGRGRVSEAKMAAAGDSP